MKKTWREKKKMQKSAKLTAVYALIMDLPLSLVITLVALALSNIDAPGSLNGPNYIRMACLAYVVTFFVNFIHAERWGFAFAAKHSQPGTLKFGILLNVVVAAVFCVILDLIMTAVGMAAGGNFAFGPSSRSSGTISLTSGQELSATSLLHRCRAALSTNKKYTNSLEINVLTLI